MNFRTALTLAVSVLLVTACDDNPTDVDDIDLVVVEAFLYSGEQVNDIRLTYTIPLGSTDTVGPPINDAEVVLRRDDTAYALVPSGSAGFYHYPGDDLQVSVGDQFRIEVTHSEQTVSGETAVPSPPSGVQISDDVLSVPEIGRRTGGGGLQGAGLDVSWDNPDDLLHFVAIESLDDTAEPILPEFARNRLGGFRFVTLPTEDDIYTISFLTLEFLGPHRARVYRVNEEYADLYLGRIQDSRDLNEPSSNIVGGLGVFSAFSSDLVLFEVVRE